MPYTFTLTATIPATPVEIYEAWLDSIGHSEMTGGEATMSDEVGAEVTAWDGYISGKYLELVPGRKIVEEWSTNEWPAEYPPSRVELSFARVAKTTRLTMVQSAVPASQAPQYRQGWKNYYWKPLRVYFAAQRKAAKG